MMNSSLHLPNKIQYSSESWHESHVFPGVRFALTRMSLGERLRLTESLRGLLLKYEFLSSGNALDKTEAGLADLLVRRLYLEVGVVAIQGLEIDGTEATVSSLIDRGPEALCDEMISIFRSTLELSEEERKNF